MKRFLHVLNTIYFILSGTNVYSQGLLMDDISYHVESLPAAAVSASTNLTNYSVGSMGGGFSVSAIGGATYTQPIEVPQGIGGLQPQLSICYSSQSGNGLCGWGASLVGASAITRGPKDIYHDETARGVNYGADDALYLDGTRLILVRGTAGRNNAVYTPESDPYTYIITHGNCSTTSNNIWFEVQSSDGMIYWYGTDQNSALYYIDTAGKQKIHSWYLSRIIQRTGNFIQYYYQRDNNCTYLALIAYGDRISNLSIGNIYSRASLAGVGPLVVEDESERSYEYEYSKTSGSIEASTDIATIDAEGNIDIRALRESISMSSSVIHTVAFEYETRGDTIYGTFDGKQSRMTKRLKSVTNATNDVLYRSYTLTYNTQGDLSSKKFSRLTSITERNGQNQSLPPLQFEWSYLPQAAVTASNLNVTLPNNLFPISSGVTFQDQSYLSGDMNDDGIDDIIGLYSHGDYTYAVIYFAMVDNNGTIQFSANSGYFTIPANSSSLCFETYLKGCTIVDINGDGKNEFILPYYNSVQGDYGRLFMYVLGGGFNGDGVMCDMMREGEPLFTTGDLLGQGRSQMIILDSEPNQNGYHLSVFGYNDNHIPSSSLYPIMNRLSNPYMSFYFSSKPKQIYVTDMDADGMQDILVICTDGYSVLHNNGAISLSMTEYTNSNELHYYDVTQTGDFNGDGLLDFITNDGSVNWYFYLNNGDGSFNRSIACTIQALAENKLFSLNNQFHCEVMDFDGDGKSDVVINKATYLFIPPFSIGGVATTYWMHSNGTSLAQIIQASSNRQNDADVTRYITGDFNGDGYVELINYGYDCINGTNSNSGDAAWHIYDNHSLSSQNNKVTAITHGMGVVTQINYSTLADNIVYTRNYNRVSAYPAPYYTLPLNVVKYVTTSNGAADTEQTQYAYSNLRIHLKGRGMMGFEKTSVSNLTTNVASESGVREWNNTYFIPRITYSTTTTSGGITAGTRTEMAIQQHTLGNRFFSYPSWVINKDVDGDSMRISYERNSVLGYLTEERHYYGNFLTRSTEYLNYIELDGLYRPQSVESVSYSPDDANNPFYQKETYAYNSIGLPIQTVQNCYSQSGALTTSLTYDEWGNVTSKLSTGNGVLPLTTHYEYDASHRFPQRIYTTPSSSVMRYTYDSWGNILTERDSINSSINNTISHSYDSWGVRTSTSKPGYGAVSFSRGWGATPSMRYYVMEQGTGQPWVKTWYDECGREVRRESVAAMNTSIITMNTYNSRGQVVTRTVTEGSRTKEYSWSYDDAGRPIREEEPNNVVRMFDYSSSGEEKFVVETLSHVDAGGGGPESNRSTTMRYDLMGNLKFVSNGGGTLTHLYASCGGVKQTTVNGAVWEYDYDWDGRLAYMSDPDAGVSTYQYDALGRETNRMDGRRVSYATSYDVLGRVTSVTASAPAPNVFETISYSYGTGGTGQSQLVEATLGNWTYRYEYDQYGRMTREDNGAHPTMYAYNQQGKVSRLTWLDYSSTNSTYMDYAYDQYGFCTSKSAMQGNVQWSLTGYGNGVTTSNISLYSSSNAFTKTTEFDDADNISSISLRRNGSTLLNSQSLNFNASTGNLTSRTKSIGGAVGSSGGSSGSGGGMITEQFIHDGADRLTQVRRGNQTVMAMTYASNGNITSKTDIGQYEYNASNKPHAVRAVDNTAGIIPNGTQTVTYNLWGKVSEVNMTVGSDTYRYELTYGPDLQRVLAVLWRNNELVHLTTYGEEYEEKYQNGNITRYFYVRGSDGNAALYTSNSQNGDAAYCMETDHLGSVTALYDRYGTKRYGAEFDVWGRRTIARGSIEYDRGFTGHEHIDELGLIDMNGRIYDPLTARFISTDPYIQSPSDPQNYNAYSYCLNNPLKYTDPSGEVVEWLVFGALLGAYSGGVIANDGQFNPTKWDFGSSKTWGYMLGGAVCGVASGWLGTSIAASSAPFANTISIMCSSSVFSVGTTMYTNRLTPVSMSFGAFSFNFTNNEWGYLGKEGNSTLEEIGYIMGGMANLSDILMGRNPQEVDLVTEHSDEIGHSSIVKKGTKTAPNDRFINGNIANADPNGIISVGPNRYTDASGSWHWMKGTNHWDTHSRIGETIWRQSIRVNQKTLSRYSNWLNRREIAGKLHYSVEISSCVSHVSTALNMSGVFNIGIHPYLLHSQIYLRSIGIRPFLYSYYLQNF